MRGIRFPENVKDELKKPLGKLVLPEDLKKEKKRIISIGDICTIALLDAGTMPHLAVYDFRTKRSEIGEKERKKLETAFPKARKYVNEKGMLSKIILKDAQKLISMGGAIVIEGEEDLTALAFALYADEKTDRLVYGQPDVGMVMIIPNKEIKEKIKKILELSTAAFGN